MNEESDFWQGGKYCYSDPKLKKEAIYVTTSMQDYGEKAVPQQFKSKENNKTRTRISEFSDAVHNNNCFKNPYFLSC